MVLGVRPMTLPRNSKTPCAVCSTTGGGVYDLRMTLEELGYPPEAIFAHPACVSREQERARRRASRQGYKYESTASVLSVAKGRRW